MDRVGPGNYPPRNTSLWPGITRSKDIAAKYAELMTELCPSLQYIRIHDWSWQVMHVWNMTLAKDEIHLRLLGYQETASIELFAFDHFAEQSGLLGPMLPYEEMTDEASDEIDARIAELKQKGLGFVDYEF
jgi:hypothetical protein